MSDGASFETERHRDDQPEREDLLDPAEVELDDADDVFVEDDDEPLPSDEELPESQGLDPLAAERATEDAAARPSLHDEEP